MHSLIATHLKSWYAEFSYLLVSDIHGLSCLSASMMPFIFFASSHTTTYPTNLAIHSAQCGFCQKYHLDYPLLLPYYFQLCGVALMVFLTLKNLDGRYGSSFHYPWNSLGQLAVTMVATGCHRQHGPYRFPKSLRVVPSVKAPRFRTKHSHTSCHLT